MVTTVRCEDTHRAYHNQEHYRVGTVDSDPPLALFLSGFSIGLNWSWLMVMVELVESFLTYGAFEGGLRELQGYSVSAWLWVSVW